MKKIKIRIVEGSGCGGCGTCDVCTAAAPYPAPRKSAHMHTSDCEKPTSYKNVHNGQEARMHRTTLAHLMADVQVLLDMVSDEDDLPEWLETKITKAGDYMSSAARYIAGNVARDHGQLEEQSSSPVKNEIKTMIDNLDEGDDRLVQIQNILKTAES